MRKAVFLDVPMSDGVVISALRYPAPASPAPAIVVMTPYRKERMANDPIFALLGDAGFEIVIGDVRGFGASLWSDYSGVLSEREIQDGVELFEWVAEADFCNGRTAGFGGSYHGINQLLIASRRPKGLRCIAPRVAPVDTYRDWTNQGGIPSDFNWAAMTYIRSGQESTTRAGIEEYTDLLLGPDNAGHWARSAEYVLDRIDVPTLCLGGWYDFFLRGTLRAFRAVNTPKRLVIGPWGHADFDDTHRSELLRWYGYWLHDQEDNPTVTQVRLWDSTSERWREMPSWPATSDLNWLTIRPVHHATSVRASLTITEHLKPPTAALMESFLPHLISGFDTNLWSEVAVFDSEPLQRQQVLLGPIGLTVWLNGEGCQDVDAYARISSVSKAGEVEQLSEGRLRSSHREVDHDRSETSSQGHVIIPWHPHLKPTPLSSEPITLVIEMEPAFASLGPDDRIRLGITFVRSDETRRPANVTVLPETTIRLPQSQ